MFKVWEQEQFRLDYRAAQTTAMILEVKRDPKKRSEPFTALDFMPMTKHLCKSRATAPKVDPSQLDFDRWARSGKKK